MSFFVSGTGLALCCPDWSGSQVQVMPHFSLTSGCDYRCAPPSLALHYTSLQEKLNFPQLRKTSLYDGAITHLTNPFLEHTHLVVSDFLLTLLPPA
jgi:hypothetical protein